MGVQMNEDRYGVVLSSLEVTSVAANTTAERDFTITGLKVGDFVAVNKPSLSAGLGVSNARVKAADTLSLTFNNNTGIAIEPAAEIYTIFWFRPEKTSGVVNP